ncbi:prepilin-type N-terminal cleavage/methylation domain-containing protein [Candidatus Parcubacteria bacterium]|nr:prepilin-type N-terminal cleavage/methylation domain-containing protein [Candidatus Parcubacteria bacterium]
MKKNLPLKNRQKGFTLLETLVAIFILTLSITGPVYIASVAFHNTIDSRDNISAQYIAEEVVEVIRNKRDGYVLSNADGSGWLVGTSLQNCVFGSTGVRCIMERDSGDYIFSVCPSSGDCLNISFDPDSTDGDLAVYGKAGGTFGISKFTREFYFETYPTNPNEVKLVVNIRWEDKGRQKLYTLSERLYSMNYKGFFKPE